MTETTAYKCRANTPVCEPVKEKGDMCMRCKWVNNTLETPASSTSRNKGQLSAMVNGVAHLRRTRWQHSK